MCPFVYFKAYSQGKPQRSALQGYAPALPVIQYHRIEAIGRVIPMPATYYEPDYVNPRFEEMAGYSKYEVLGQAPRIFKSGKHNDSFYAEIWKTIKSGHNWKGRIWNIIKKTTP